MKSLRMIPIRKINSWFVPAILLGVIILMYGLFVNQLGFYWDDWGFAWVGDQLGIAGLREHFIVRTPLRTIYDEAFVSLLGTNRVAWQAFALLTHWLASVAMWWFLRQAWPQRERAVLVAALFFTAYPGFSQQPLARTYNYAWSVYAAFFLSMGLMLFAVRNRRYFWPAIVGSIVLSGISLFSLDYFSGLELLRPVFLWLVLNEKTGEHKQWLKQTVWIYLPFAIIFIVFLYWRAFGFSAAMYQPEFQAVPGTDSLLSRVIQSLLAVTLNAWGKVIQFPSMDGFGLRFILIYLVIVIGTSLGGYILLEKIPFTNETAVPSRAQWKHALVLVVVGCVAMLAAGIPAYSVGLSVKLNFPYDRLTFPFMFGVSIFLVGVLELIPFRSLRFTLVTILLALAVGYHLQNAYQYREDWKSQRELLWQLAWRAPTIAPGTIILSDDAASIPYNDDEALTFMINWTYAPGNGSSSVPYASLFISERFGATLPGEDEPIEIDRSWIVSLQGSTSQVLVMWYAPPACLRVLDPVYDGDLVQLYLDPDWPERREQNLIRLMPELTAQALPFSRTGLISPSPDQPAQVPVSLFGQELPHKWCYYFEKADLARQLGDWDQVVRLGDEVFSIPYYPLDFAEYLPFIEGYTRLKRWEDAEAYTFKVAGRGPVLLPSLCAVWQRAEDQLTLSEAEQQVVQDMKEYLGVCPFP